MTGVAGVITIVARVGGPGESIRAATRGTRRRRRAAGVPGAADRSAGRRSARGHEAGTRRNQPAPARRARRAREGDDASIDRGHRLIRRSDNGLAAIRHREAAGQRVLANRDLEERGEIVERDQLAAVVDDRGNRPPAVLWTPGSTRALVSRPRRGGECDAGARRVRRACAPSLASVA